MNKQFTAQALFLSLAILPGCFWSSQKQEAKSEQKLSGLVIINVLDDAAYKDCHIEGSINVPFESVEEFAKNKLAPDAEVVCYCSNYMCTASGHACKALKKLGFNAFAYEGGTAEWFQLGHPVVGACKASYLNKPNSKPAQEHTEDINVITAQELLNKIEKNKGTAA